MAGSTILKQLFIASYYGQLSAYIKVNDDRSKPVLLAPMDRRLFMLCDALHDFSVLLRTGSNPADIDRF